MAELVDARDLKSLGLYGCAGSTPALGTIKIKGLQKLSVTPFLLKKVFVPVLSRIFSRPKKIGYWMNDKISLQYHSGKIGNLVVLKN